VIRKAELKDKTDISRLHYMAAPNIFNYFFASTEKTDARNFGSVI